MLVGFLLYSAHMHPDISLIFQLLSIPTTFLVTHELQDRTQMHCCNAKILGPQDTGSIDAQNSS